MKHFQITPYWDINTVLHYFLENIKNIFSPSKTIEKKYPQIEKDGDLKQDSLEMGWPFQCFTLQKYGLTIEGPSAESFITPVTQNELLHAASSIIKLWNDQAHDQNEVKWLENRSEQTFVVLTLCRFHYLMSNKTIASKSDSAQWAINMLDKKWVNLINKANKKMLQEREVDKNEIQTTIEFIEFALETINSKY